MRAIEFLAELTQQNIHLAPDGGRLLYDAPQGVLTPRLLAELKEYKAELLALLSRKEEWEERAAIMEFDGGLPRREAEQLALELIRKEKL